MFMKLTIKVVAFFLGHPVYRALHNCKETQEMRALCMFDWQGTQTFFSRSGMLNPKFSLSCVHCVIQILQLLLSCVHCVIQIAQFERSFKLRTLLSCENSLERLSNPKQSQTWQMSIRFCTSFTRLQSFKLKFGQACREGNWRN